MSRDHPVLTLRTSALVASLVSIVVMLFLLALVNQRLGFAQITAFSLLSLAFGYATFHILSRAHLAALSRLANTLRNFDQANGSVPSLEAPQGELKDLGEGLSTMLAAMASRESKLVAAQRELELRVSEVAVSNAELAATLRRLKAAQEQLVTTEKMASLGGLVAGVAHEINTPVGVGVTAVSSMSSRIIDVRNKYQAGELGHRELNDFLDNTQQHCELLLSNLSRAAELVSSFKQVAVDQSADGLREFDLGVYLSEVWRSLSPQLKGTSLRYDMAVNDDIRVFNYPGALSQVLTNLVMNSITHGYERGEEGHLQLDVRQDGGEVELVYRDDGRGIAPEHLGQVFEPFFTTRRGRGGSGLGMHIVYNLVTGQLLGSIDLHSEPGHGVEVRIRFPIDIKSGAQTGNG